MAPGDKRKEEESWRRRGRQGGLCPGLWRPGGSAVWGGGGPTPREGPPLQLPTPTPWARRPLQAALSSGGQVNPVLAMSKGHPWGAGRAGFSFLALSRSV